MKANSRILIPTTFFLLVLFSSALAETSIATEGELRSIMSDYQDSIDKSLLETQRTMTARMDALENQTRTAVAENQAVLIERIKAQELKFLSMFTAFALFFVCGVGLVWSVLLGTKWYSYRRYKKQVMEENKDELIDLAAKKHKKEMHGKIAADIAQKYIEFCSMDPNGFIEEHPEFAKKIGMTWMKRRVAEQTKEETVSKDDEFDKFWRQK